MPIQENSQLDDQIAFDGDVSFSGGQASNVRKNTIAEGAYSIGKNTDFDTFGNIVSRKGVAMLIGNSTSDRWGSHLQLSGDALVQAVWGDTTVSNYYSGLWTAVLSGSARSLAYFDSGATERIVLAELDEYSVGTASQSGSTITGVGTKWDTDNFFQLSSMVGKSFRFADGTSAGAVTSVDSDTSLTVGTSQTVTSQGYIAYNAKIKAVNESASVADTGGTFDPESSSVYFSQLVDRLYYCDGVNDLAYITSSAGLGSIVTGKITSVEMTEIGSGYTSAPTVTFSAGSGSTATGTAVLGYGGKVQRVDIPEVSQGSGYSALTPPTVSFSAAPTGGVDAKGIAHISQTPDKPKLLTSHTNRLFCTSADTAIPSDTLYVSDILDGESWDIIGNAIRVGDGTGDPITAIASWYSYNLLVFKERSVWVVEANPAVAVADWPIKLINNRVGCVAHKSIQQVGSDVFFMSHDGIRSLSTIESGAQTDVSIPISAPINDQFKQNTIGFEYKSCSAFYDKRYMISVCSNGSETPNRTYVYNTDQKSWSGFWTSWQPNDFAVTGFSGKTRLQFGDQSGKIFTWLNFIELNEESESFYLDQTTPYETELVTRAYNFKEIYAPKTGYQVEFDLDNELSQDQQISFFLLKNMDGYESQILQENGYEVQSEDDDDLTQTFLDELESDVVIGNGKRHFIKGFNLLSKGKFEDIQFVVATDSGRLSLHSVKTSAFPDTINPQR